MTVSIKLHTYMCTCMISKRSDSCLTHDSPEIRQTHHHHHHHHPHLQHIQEIKKKLDKITGSIVAWYIYVAHIEATL